MTFEKVNAKGKTIYLDTLLAKKGEDLQTASARLASMGWNISQNADDLVLDGQEIKKL